MLRYAEPLLAERAYIAEQAQAVEVRRSGGVTTLRETAATALGLQPGDEGIAWDARRREDGKWVVTARFAEQGRARQAEWTYDHAGRNLHPLDDSAKALMGVRTVAADDLDPITDALDLIAERAPETGESRPRLVAVPDADEDTDEDALPVAVEEPEAPTPEAGGSGASAQTVTIPHPSAPAAPAGPAVPAAAAPAKAKGRKRRASVPSWDEILFGATKPEDE